MNYTIEEGKGEVKIAFTLTAEEWDASLNKAYLKNKSKFNIPGFRKGHATRKMIEKRNRPRLCAARTFGTP